MSIIKIEILFLVNINKKYSEENETSAQFYIILNSKINKCSLTLTVTVIFFQMSSITTQTV